MGKKIRDFKAQRDASRGRKSKAGGGIKSDSIIYTPVSWLSQDGEVAHVWFENCDRPFEPNLHLELANGMN